MRKLIYVTEEDIRLGERDHPFTCPVARAVRRQLNTENVSIYGMSARIESRFIALSRRVGRFIGKFDRYKPVEPFRFWLTVPDA